MTAPLVLLEPEDAIAWAPFERIWREMTFKPCTSVTEYIIMMSAGPT